MTWGTVALVMLLSAGCSILVTVLILWLALGYVLDAPRARRRWSDLDELLGPEDDQQRES